MASPTSTTASAGLDLSQFYQIFFEEAGENLEKMEQMLLELDVASAEEEALNAIFRCAHSVKGGAATFGFADVAELTHHMESLLDKLRRHELAPTAEMVDVLLAAGDALKAQLARHQGNDAEMVETRPLLKQIETLSHAGQAAAMPTAAKPAVATPSPTQARAAAMPPPASPLVRERVLTIGPLADMSVVESIAELFDEIDGLGVLQPLDGGQEVDGLRRFKVITASPDEELLDLFGFHVERDKLRLEAMDKGYGFFNQAPGSPPVEAPTSDPGYGFFEMTPAQSVPTSAAAAFPLLAPPSPTAQSTPLAPAEIKAAPVAGAATPAAPRAKAGSTTDSSTLRVSVEKVDQLINLVGELVITQAMLAQNSKGGERAYNEQMLAGLNDLERNTRDLQEAVMSIRMIPMSLVFNRFPRMLRDLASKLGKKVEMVTLGEATELDKGLVEKITDPLTHLVRNSADHGIEPPETRLQAGKPEHGTITLVASHQGGSIVIEVRDDGRGLNRQKLLKTARGRGIEAPDSLSDTEVYNLIMAPGFSTAEEVTDVSGRGVGMDVVKKNITSLGGTVEIESTEGKGMVVKVRLPLTLAIMDGMSVGVEHECYILPLASVLESFQVQATTIKTLSGDSRVVQVRGEYMPVIELERVFQIPRSAASQASAGIMLVVEADGQRLAVLVDELLGQQQVVVKNLEANYRRVPYVSGATILGDGRVALILDVGALVRSARL
jgi:two-component system, chemotaxis family, sensor kinase CheA